MYSGRYSGLLSHYEHSSSLASAEHVPLPHGVTTYIASSRSSMQFTVKIASKIVVFHFAMH